MIVRAIQQPLYCNGRRYISSSALQIERKTKASSISSQPKKHNLTFGTTFSDHMLMIEWDLRHAWSPPRIVPFQNLSISPAASALHYGLQCFEGMKAYKGNDSSVRLFRPDKNMKRLSNSMRRLHMPGADFDPDELVKCIAELVRIDSEWIPSGNGYSLYVRPTVIATHPYLGLSAPSSILLYVVCSPVGPYYKSGFEPIRLIADTQSVRAWPGGTGANKVGGNYGSTMKAQGAANEKGYDQVLWLFNDEVTEVGSMNIFFVFKKKDGTIELVTPPLDRGDILPGVTRDSILHLSRSWNGITVSERFPSMAEIKAASKSGTLLEAFGTGTAAVVTPIRSIQYKGEDVKIPATGPLTLQVWDEITGIQYGKVDGPEGWSIRI